MSLFAQTLKMWAFTPPGGLTQPRPAAPARAVVTTGEGWLEALQTGRPATWLRFYDAHAPWVLSVLRRVLGPDRELEDLLQDVFARALAGVGRVKTEEALKPWLRSIAVFTARELLRKRKWRAWLPLGDSNEEEGVLEIPTTTDALEERLLLRRVKAVLDAMAVEDRLAFTLRHFEGLELTELAEAMHVSLSTAKRRVTRADASFHRRVAADAELSAWLSEGTVSSP